MKPTRQDIVEDLQDRVLHDWEEDYLKDQTILRAIEQEDREHCAICRECVNKLAKKGGYSESRCAY